MGYKCGRLCNEQDKRDPRPCVHLLLLSQDDELLNWEQSLPESPGWYYLLIKHVYSVHFPRFSLQISTPHRDYTAVNIVNGMNGVRNLRALFCPTALCSIAGLMIWSHSSLFKLCCMLRRRTLVSASVCLKIFLFISAAVSDYSWPFVNSSFLVNNKLQYKAEEFRSHVSCCAVCELSVERW